MVFLRTLPSASRYAMDYGEIFPAACAGSDAYIHNSFPLKNFFFFYYKKSGNIRQHKNDDGVKSPFFTSGQVQRLSRESDLLLMQSFLGFSAKKV